MELTLFYRGVLGSNKGKVEKHSLRRVFHRQLALYWSQSPMKSYRFLWNPTENRHFSEVSIRHSLGPYEFVPLVNERMRFVADIHIQLFRPDPPGIIKVQAGDLDNRVKTLLDALRMPRLPNEIPSDASPNDDERPFFCLLEDDALINSFSVTTHRWLEPSLHARETMLIISIKTAVTHLTALNSDLAGIVI